MTNAVAVDQNDGRVPCGKCGKRHKWRAKLAGQKARCPCGAVVVMPAEQPEELPVLEEDVPVLTDEMADDSDELQLAEPVAISRELDPRFLVPASGTSRVAAALANREDEVQASVFKERYLPMGMLITGVLLNFVLWQFIEPSFLKSLGFAAGMLALQVVVFVPATVFAMIMVARVMGLAIGELGPALFKIVAVTLGTGAIADVAFFIVMRELGADIYALAGGLFIYTALCGFPLKLLIEIELTEMMAVVGISIVPRLAIFFGIAMMMPTVFEH